MRDKKIKRIADILFPLAKIVILTRFPYYRAYPPEELAEQVACDEKKILCEPDTERAFRMAQQLAGPDGIVVVAGSLFIVGEIKKIIRNSIPA
jgi:dihydrofolate synthase/folylpolyglutamate synthase